MNQIARRKGNDLKSFGNQLRARIDSHAAVDQLNAAINGKPITMVQFNSIRLAIDKCLPSLAAVFVDVAPTGPANIHDLNAMLLSNGLPALDSSPEPASAEKDE